MGRTPYARARRCSTGRATRVTGVELGELSGKASPTTLRYHPSWTGFRRSTRPAEREDLRSDRLPGIGPDLGLEFRHEPAVLLIEDRTHQLLGVESPVPGHRLH